MQIICMYAANSHALLSFKFNYSNTSIRSLLYNIIQTNRPAHFCRIVLNTFSYFNKSEVVMIYERRGERSFVLGALDFDLTLIVFTTFDSLCIWTLHRVCSEMIYLVDFDIHQSKHLRSRLKHQVNTDLYSSFTINYH